MSETLLHTEAETNPEMEVGEDRLVHVSHGQCPRTWRGAGVWPHSVDRAGGTYKSSSGDEMHQRRSRGTLRIVRLSRSGGDLLSCVCSAWLSDRRMRSCKGG